MRGHIKKRGRDTYSVIVSQGSDPATGRRRQTWRTVRGSKRDAEAVLTQLLAQKDSGIDLPPGRVTIAVYLGRWLESYARPNTRPRTYESYELLIRKHTLPLLGRLPLAKLAPSHLQQLYADRLRAGLSPMTVRHLHAVLHKAFGDAVTWGLAGRNVVDAVSPPRAPRREIQTLSSEQARAFLDAASGDRLEALYVVALTTGMRQGELLGLPWSAVDLERGTVQVRGSLQRTRDNRPAIVEPKTPSSRRQVMLTRTATAALRRHRTRQLEERLRLGPAWNESDLVFTSEIGTPLSATNLVRRSFRRLLERAGLPRIRFHDLRHTAATLLLGEGQHPKLVADMLGHSRISTTLDLYSHTTPAMHREAAEVLDALLGSGQGGR